MPRSLFPKCYVLLKKSTYHHFCAAAETQQEHWFPYHSTFPLAGDHHQKRGLQKTGAAGLFSSAWEGI